jgi:hypothetical protein
LSTIRAHPGAWHELPVFPFAEWVHPVCAIRVLVKPVFDVHENAHNFGMEKSNRAKKMLIFPDLFFQMYYVYEHLSDIFKK